MRSDFTAPVRLASVYILFSAIWILSSDYLLTALVSDVAWVARLQTVKGLAFVLCSSLLIFYVSYRDRLAHRHLLDALTRNTRLLVQAQHNAALGIWEYNGHFRWSAEALQLLGRDEGNATGSLEQLLTWLHPTDRPPVQRALLALLEQQVPLRINARLYQPHRSQVTWLMLRGDADTEGLVLGTLQEVTNQKRDELALRESEQRFRQLFEQTPRIAVQGYDRERRVIYWNQASAQLYGYTLQEAMGKRLEELIVPPTARNQVATAINHWMLGGPPIPASEVQLQRKDGARLWVYSSHLMMRNNRDQLEMYCVDIDLTEQKQIDNELRVSEARHRELVEQMSDVIFLTDLGGLLSFLNPAWEKLSGYVGYESLGRPLSQFFDSADAVRLHQQLLGVASREHLIMRGEFRLLTRQSQLRWVEVQVSKTLPDHSLRGSLRDIHERYQAQQLQQARNAVLDELLARRPLEQILEGITRRLQDLNPHMLVSIMLLDADYHLHLVSGPDLPPDYRNAIDGIKADLEVGSCGHAARSGELVIAEDLSTHPYWQAFRELTQAAGLGACWSLPFKDESGQVLGTFAVYYRKPVRPSASDIALVTEFTRLAGLAVHQGMPDNPSSIERLRS